MKKRTLGLAALLLTAGMATSWAEFRQLDAIIAVVEDDVILASELMGRLEKVRDQLEKQNPDSLPSNDVLISQLMERLIIENLQLQEADRRGIDIDDETLTRAVLRFAEQNQMTLPQFQAALAADGVDYREFREEIRREMVISRVQRGMISRRVTISEQEVDDLLGSPFFEELLADEFRVGHILLTVEEGASEDVARAALAKADDIVSELREGADFAKAAFENSSASTAPEGGDMGWRRAGALPTLFAETVLSMEQGEVSEPIVTGGSIHIIKLLGQRGAGMQQEMHTLARHILLKPSEIRTEQETKALMDELHQRLVAGEDFDAMAKEFSEDPGTALKGGELGWTSGKEFVPTFQEAMAATGTGGLSAPFRSRYGYHVIEVLDRREEDMSDETRKDMALRILHDRRFEEERQSWLKEIRDEAFVEVRFPSASGS